MPTPLFEVLRRYNPAVHEIVMRLGDEALVVRMRDGGLRLAGRGSRLGIDLRGSSPARVPAGDRVAVAGCLPHGVAAVTVIDDAGAEHAATIQGQLWMVVVDAFSEELVRYVDANGEIVSVVPPGEHRPITDAHDACPVCTVVRWVQVENEGMTLITCGSCGFVVCGMGGPPLDTTGWPRPTRSGSRQRGATVDQARLAKAPYRVYQPAGTAARVTKQSGEGAEMVSIELINAADTVTVISSLPSRSPFGTASLQAWFVRARPLNSDDFVYSLPATSVRHAAERRAAGRLAWVATPDTRTFSVDGERVAFEFLDTGAGWTARREHEGTKIVITARIIDPAGVALERFGL